MSVSSKCYYALRAVYALADHAGPDPLKTADIAEREQIPIRFLEVILNQLKGGGFVQSRRGAEGGYRLARSAEHLTVGEIMRYIDGLPPADIASILGESANTISVRLHRAVKQLRLSINNREFVIRADIGKSYGESPSTT